MADDEEPKPCPNCGADHPGECRAMLITTTINGVKHMKRTFWAAGRWRSAPVTPPAP